MVLLPLILTVSKNYSGRLYNESRVKNVSISIILSSCENWLSGTAKILLQLDSLNQYDRFELQHQYVTINIKEVMSIQRFLHFT